MNTILINVIRDISKITNTKVVVNETTEVALNNILITYSVNLYFDYTKHRFLKHDFINTNENLVLDNLNKLLNKLKEL